MANVREQTRVTQPIIHKNFITTSVVVHLMLEIIYKYELGKFNISLQLFVRCISDANNPEAVLNCLSFCLVFATL